MNPETIIHTPGGYYAFAYWLACNLILWYSPLKQSRIKRVITQAVFFAVLLSIMTISDDKPDAAFVPLMLLYVIMIYVDIYINCRYDSKTALHFAIRAFIIGEFAASFQWQMEYYARTNVNVPESWFVDMGILLGVHLIVFGLLGQLEKKNRLINSKLEIKNKEMLSTLIIGFVVFTMSNFSFIIEKSPFSSQFASEIFFIRTLVDLAGVAILFAYHMLLGELKVMFEVNKLQDMLNMQYSNYEMLESSIAAVNQKYHDLKYQIAVLKQETDTDKNLSYLDKMEQEIKLYEAQNKTGNKVLDIILTGKSLYCSQNWIELTSVADGHAIDFMDDMDISTLFGNALDNAIESTSKIGKKEKRLIHLVVAKQNNFVRIRIENCYEEKLTFIDGMPLTTKSDAKNHGYGLKSIENTVKKYGGSVMIHAADGWFELRILIPVE